MPNSLPSARIPAVLNRANVTVSGFAQAPSITALQEAGPLRTVTLRQLSTAGVRVRAVCKSAHRVQDSVHRRENKLRGGLAVAEHARQAMPSLRTREAWPSSRVTQTRQQQHDILKEAMEEPLPEWLTPKKGRCNVLQV